jgi:hypothetical protein
MTVARTRTWKLLHISRGRLDQSRIGAGAQHE